MTPPTLRKIIKRLFPEGGGQTKLARKLGVDPSTVRRWLSGSTIPKPTIIAIESLEREQCSS